MKTTFFTMTLFSCVRLSVNKDKCTPYPQEGLCFIFGPPRNWNEARTKCDESDGDLIQIETEEKANFIKDLINQKNTSHWIGLDDIDNDGRFNYPDGAVMVSNDSWAQISPRQEGDDCVIHGTNYTRWHPQHCNMRHPFVCEILSFPKNKLEPEMGPITLRTGFVHKKMFRTVLGADVLLKIFVRAHPQPSKHSLEINGVPAIDDENLYVFTPVKQMMGIVTYKILNVTREITNDYSLLVSNGYGDALNYTFRIQLVDQSKLTEEQDKKGPPKLSQGESQDKRFEPRVGEDLTLNVFISSNPKPTDYAVELDGVSVEGSEYTIDFTRMENNGGLLRVVIFKMVITQSGHYVIVINNGFDPALNYTFTVEVEGPPKLSQGESQDKRFERRVGEDLTLNVFISSNPKPTDYTVELDGVSVEGSKYTIDFTRMENHGGLLRVVIFKMVITQTGHYVIVINNGFDPALNYTFTVEVEGSPELSHKESQIDDFKYKVGQTLQLDITIITNPEPTDYVLELNGEIMDDTKYNMTFESLSHVTGNVNTNISLYSIEQSGVYVIKIRNDIAPTLNYRFTLLVHDPSLSLPKIKVSSDVPYQNTTVEFEGIYEDIAFECILTGSDKYVRYMSLQCGLHKVIGKTTAALVLNIDLSLFETQCLCRSIRQGKDVEYAVVYLNVSGTPILHSDEQGYKVFFCYPNANVSFHVQIMSNPDPILYNITHERQPFTNYDLEYYKSNTGASGIVHVKMFLGNTSGQLNFKIMNGIGEGLDIPINITFTDDLDTKKSRSTMMSLQSFTNFVILIVSGIIILSVIGAVIGSSRESNRAADKNGSSDGSNSGSSDSSVSQENSAVISVKSGASHSNESFISALAEEQKDKEVEQPKTATGFRGMMRRVADKFVGKTQKRIDKKKSEDYQEDMGAESHTTIGTVTTHASLDNSQYMDFQTIDSNDKEIAKVPAKRPDTSIN